MTHSSTEDDSQYALDPSEEELNFDVSPDPLEDPDPVILGQKTACFCWRLICPPENWQDPIPLEAGEVRLLELLSRRLNLVVNRDDKRKKIYLGTALGLIQDDDKDKDKDKDKPDSPTKAKSGLRYPNGWMAPVIPNQEAGEEYAPVDVEAAAPLIPAFPDAQISKSFRLSEFRPGDHTYDLIRLGPQLVNVLEDIRYRAGDQPLHITSGYRPPAYNRKVGGVSNSAHIDGLAADIYSDYLTIDKLHDICDRVIGDRGGVGYYPTQGFIHVDLRGYRARW